MSKIKLSFLIFFLSVLYLPLFSQNSTNSPYSRYGYGKLSDQSFTPQRGMGGIGYGLRNSKMINTLNPASFSSVDSMTFMIELGASGQLGWFKDPLYNASSQKFNGNIEYLAMQFPLSNAMGMGVGFKPISSVGYQYGQGGNVEGSNVAYSGSGGVNKIYGALSYDFFNRLSLGVNIGYLFGETKHNSQVTFSETGSYPWVKNDTLRINGLSFEIGFQYTHPLNNDQYLILGGVYTPKVSLSGKSMESKRISQSSSSSSTNQYEVRSDYGFDMPESYALGITYNKKNKLTVGADFLLEKWSDSEFYSKTDSLSDRSKITLGAEYTPDFRSRNYLNRIRYRIGGHYSDSYVKVGKEGYKDYGVSLGFGLPIVGDRSFLNLSFEYSFLKPDVSSMIDERYFKFTLSYTFNELWFHKRKVQ